MTTRQTYSYPSRQQRFVTAICISVISVVYLAGYIVIHRVPGVHPNQTVAAIQFGPHSSSSPRLEYAPDYTPPIVEDGLAPILSRIDTEQPVVFLTIDDGVYREPEALARMRAAGVPASFFLTHRYVSASTSYFSTLAQQTGSTVQNHTFNHRDMRALSLKDQVRELCDTNDSFAKLYGKRPILMRPPYGFYDANTQRATAQCGMRAVVLWRAIVENGAMQYQSGNTKLQPGDIVLMHFMPDFKKDLQAFVDASHAAGLKPQLLDDWIAR